VLFFQEEGLEGTFVIDLNIDQDDTAAVASDEITDPKDLEFLSKLNIEGEGNVDDGQDEEDEESQDEEDECNQDEEHLALDPNDY
jgi:hypothetical protein